MEQAILSSMPEAIKQQILQLLAQNNFVAAKQLRDAWLKKQNENPRHH